MKIIGHFIKAIRRKILLNFVIVLTLLAYALPSSALPPEEKTLANKVYDIQSLVASGVNYNEYSKYVSELVIILGRYARTKPANKSAMAYAAESYIDAKASWSESLQKIAQTDDPKIVDIEKDLMNSVLQINWDTANKQIKTFETESSQFRKKSTRQQ